ncbi:MAG: hypothetical protein Q7R95_05135 [bacterium]|nr:hypothetical protein [bacterium]
MGTFDIAQYNELFFKTVKEYIDTFEKSMKINDFSEMHRMVHMIKSQHVFMGYQQSAQFYLSLEKIFYNMKNNNTSFSPELLSTINVALTIMHKNFKSIEQQHKEIDLHTIISDLEKYIPKPL